MRPKCSYGCSIVAMSRTIVTPGVSAGTMSIEARWEVCASGSVTAMTIRKSATEALEENHLWPLMTHSSPSSSARVWGSVGSGPGVSGSVIENAERRSPLSSGYRYWSFWSSVPAMARISELPESGAALPNTGGANGVVPRISCMRPSLTWPKPWPPRSGGRWAAHSPRSLTCSLSGAIARSKPSWPSSSNTVSIGQISSRTNSRIQSSFCWNSGSVEKSHAMSVPPPSGRCPEGWQVIRRRGVVGALEIAAGVAVLAGAALQSATGFGFALVSAPLLFAATEPAEAVGLLILLGLVVNLMTLGTEGRRPRPLVRDSLVMVGFGIPGVFAGVVLLHALSSTALQIGVTLGVFATLAVRALARRRGAGPGMVPGWAAPAAGFTSGALATSTNTSGPPVVLYALARGATPVETRDPPTRTVVGLPPPGP